MAETTEKRASVQNLQEEPENLAGNGPSRRRPEILEYMDFLFFLQSPAEWPLYEKELYQGNEVVVETLHSIPRFKSLHSNQLIASKLLETCFIQYSFLEEIF